MFAFMVGLAILIALGIMLGAGPTNAITVVRASIGIVFVVSMSVAIAGIGVRRLHDRGKTVLLGARRRGAAAEKNLPALMRSSVLPRDRDRRKHAAVHWGGCLFGFHSRASFLGFSDLGRGHMLCGNLSVV